MSGAAIFAASYPRVGATSTVYGFEMTSAGGDRVTAVGSRVRTVGEPVRSGTVVEDFGELAGATVRLGDGRSATGRRWAIALDDGTLVFLDSEEIERA